MHDTNLCILEHNQEQAGGTGKGCGNSSSPQAKNFVRSETTAIAKEGQTEQMDDFEIASAMDCEIDRYARVYCTNKSSGDW